MEDKYFANLPTDELGSTLYTRVTDFYDECERNGRMRLWRKSHRMYYATNEYGVHEASEIGVGGEEGELDTLKINQYRNLLQHLLVILTQNRVSFEVRAVNTDYSSQIQTILGRNILDYYMRDMRLNGDFHTGGELAILHAESYFELTWDENAGELVSPGDEDEEGNATAPVFTGDVKCELYEPINVIRNVRSNVKGKQPWYILRSLENKFDLAAENPLFAEKILRHDDTEYELYLTREDLSQHETGSNGDDLVPVYKFYHRKSPACPEGKVVKFLSSGLVIKNSPLDLPVFPVIDMVPYKQHGTSFGYSVSFDLIVVQEALDIIYSTILSNQSTFGVQNIWMKPGSNLNPHQLGGGLNIFESNDKPEAINLTSTPPEIFNFMKDLTQIGEVLSGVNSVARGQPEASLKSGAALAMIASQAIQFANGLQSAYVQAIEDVGTAIIKILQEKSKLPRAALISGKDKRAYMKEFVGDDLKGINRVIVDVGNAMSSTISGRIEMAKDLMQGQQIQSPEQYIQVIETGRLDPMVDDERSEALLIDAENEALRSGDKPAVAIAIDQHLQHIKGHRQVLADPESRMDAELTKRTLAHITEHLNQLRQVDPSLLNALGQSPIGNPGAPPGQGAQAPQPNAKPPMPPGGPQAGPPQAGQKMPPPPNVPQEMAAAMPTIPKPPQ